jgi:hypothetical protein
VAAAFDGHRPTDERRCRHDVGWRVVVVAGERQPPVAVGGGPAVDQPVNARAVRDHVLHDVADSQFGRYRRRDQEAIAVADDRPHAVAARPPPARMTTRQNFSENLYQRGSRMEVGQSKSTGVSYKRIRGTAGD